MCWGGGGSERTKGIKEEKRKGGRKKGEIEEKKLGKRGEEEKR